MPPTPAQPADPRSPLSLFKGIAQDSTLYSIALIAPRFAGIALLPITTRCLVPADYGVADLLEQVSVVMSLLIGVNLSAALGYFYFQSEGAEWHTKVSGTAVGGAFLVGLAAAALYLPFSGLTSRLVFGGGWAQPFLWVTLGLLPFAFALEALMAWLRVENRTRAFVAVSWLRVAVTVVGTIFLVGLLRLRVWGVVSTSVLAIVVVAAALAVYQRRLMKPEFDFRLLLRMLRFSLPLGFSGIAMFVIHVGDRFILPHYRSFAELGLYTTAYKIGLMITIPAAAFQTYWSAQVFQIARREDAARVMARLFTYVVAVLTFCGLGLVVSARPALRLLAAPAFQGAAPLVPVIVMAYFCRAVGEYFRCLFVAAGRPGYDAICTWIGGVACAGGYFFLIPAFGMWGAAFATLGTFVLLAVLSAVWSYRVAPYRVEAGRLAKLAIAAAAVAVPYVSIPVERLPLQIVWACLLMLLYPAALLALGFPTGGERDVVLRSLRAARARVAAIVFSRQA